MNGHLRIGDAEREQAASALGEHFVAGRIDHDEHAERLDRVWAARTHADLAPLFRDLPPLYPAAQGRTPYPPVVAGPTFRPPARRRRTPPLAMIALLLVLALLVDSAAVVVVLLVWVFVRAGHRPSRIDPRFRASPVRRW